MHCISSREKVNYTVIRRDYTNVRTVYIHRLLALKFSLPLSLYIHRSVRVRSSPIHNNKPWYAAVYLEHNNITCNVKVCDPRRWRAAACRSYAFAKRPREA